MKMNQPSWMLNRLAGVSILLTLMLNSAFVANAQNSSIPLNVKGTWKGYTEIVEIHSEGADINPINFTYSFDGTGKASSTSNYSKYNSGTYKITGNSILITFPDYYVDATIDGNRMKGVFIDREEYERSVWAAERISSVSKSEQPTSNANREQTPEQRAFTADELKAYADSPARNSSYPNVIRNAEGKLSPAKGYQWVNPNDPNDFRIELIPGNISDKRSSDLTGNWEGTYICGQGLTNLKLVISQNSSSEISAIFKFSATKSNSSVPPGSFRMTGTYDNRTNKIVLKATQWVIRPAGYVTVDLVGKVSQGNTKISGEVVSSSCSTFTLEKK